MKVINAEDCVVGRLASHVAKMLLEGEEVVIINAEKAMVTGTPKHTEEFFSEKIKRGDPYHGPFYPKKADGILRRVIRGMLPYHKPRGRTAYKRLKVYKSVPGEFKTEQAEIINKSKSKSDCKFIYLKDISNKFGG